MNNVITLVINSYSRCGDSREQEDGEEKVETVMAEY